MALLAKLLDTPQPDNTAMTAGNSGFSSLQTGSGNTAIHLAASAMGAAAGYRFTQATAQNFAYLDLGAAQSVFSWRTPFRYGATPTANCSIFRAYPATDHITNLWTINLTTANRVQAVEGSGTMNVASPSGSPLSAGVDYVGLGLFTVETGAWSFRVYERGSTDLLFDLLGTCSSPVAVQAIRWGIGTASSLAQLNFNDELAIGNADYLPRPDVTTPLSVALAVSPASGPTSAERTFTATPTGGNGNPVTYAWAFGDGATQAAGASPTASHTYAVAGEYTATVTWSQS